MVIPNISDMLEYTEDSSSAGQETFKGEALEAGEGCLGLKPRRIWDFFLRGKIRFYFGKPHDHSLDHIVEQHKTLSRCVTACFGCDMKFAR